MNSLKASNLEYVLSRQVELIVHDSKPPVGDYLRRITLPYLSATTEATTEAAPDAPAEVTAADAASGEAD